MATETHYYVKCRMGVEDTWYIAGWANTEVELQDLMTDLKKTWRYAYPVSYQARAIVDKQPKRGKK